MGCHEIRGLLSEYIDGALDPEKTREIRRHLAQCEGCSQELAGLKNVVDSLDSLEPVRAPDDFLERVHARIHQRSFFKRLVHALFVPAPIKIPLECAGVLATAALVALLFGIPQRYVKTTHEEGIHEKGIYERGIHKEGIHKDGIHKGEELVFGRAKERKGAGAGEGAQEEKIRIVKSPQPPVASQPVASQPVTSQPVTSQPVTSQPVASQPVTSQPMTPQPSGTEKYTGLQTLNEKSLSAKDEPAANVANPAADIGTKQKPIEVALMLAPDISKTREAPRMDMAQDEERALRLAARPSEEGAVPSGKAAIPSGEEYQREKESLKKQGRVEEDKALPGINDNGLSRIRASLEKVQGRCISTEYDPLTYRPLFILAEVPAGQYSALLEELASIGTLEKPFRSEPPSLTGHIQVRIKLLRPD